MPRRRGICYLRCLVSVVTFAVQLWHRKEGGRSFLLSRAPSRKSVWGASIRHPRTCGCACARESRGWTALGLPPRRERERERERGREPLQNSWGRDSARAKGAPLVHSPNERERERERESERKEESGAWDLYVARKRSRSRGQPAPSKGNTQ